MFRGSSLYLRTGIVFEMTTLILGLGYTGEVLKRRLDEEGGELITTTKSSGLGDLDFDLMKDSTWLDLPEAETTFWLFPAEDKKTTLRFLKSNGSRLGKLIVLSSTGFFKPQNEDGEVTENSPLDLENERVKSEEALREYGAVIVHASGIYGPRRDPREWVKSGHIPYTKKWVNFIQVSDLATFLLQAAKLGENKKHYIASDNQPQQWNQLIDEWKLPKTEGTPKRISKKVNSTNSIKALQVDLEYSSVREGIASC